MRKFLIVLILAGAAAGVYLWHGHDGTAHAASAHASSAAAPSEPVIPERLIVIADITNSLEKEEINTTYKLVADIFRLAPEDTEIIVYPVVAEVETVPAFQDSVLVAPVPALKGKVDLWRRNSESKALRMLQSVAESGRNKDQTYASCISLALRRAARMIEPSENPAKTDIIVISDMVEECRNSVLGGAVRLNKQDLSPFIKTASTMQPPMDLKGARVVTIFPSAAPSGNPHANRPERAALERFWNVLLQRSDADMKRSHVDDEYQQYFLTLGIEHKQITDAEAQPPRLQAPQATKNYSKFHGGG